MTPTHRSDDAILAMFERRAARALPADLGDAVRTRTASIPQAATWPIGSRSATLPRLLIAAAVATAIVGAIATGGGARRPESAPSPRPSMAVEAITVRADRFVVPFGIAIPPASALRLVEIRPDAVTFAVPMTDEPRPSPLLDPDVWPGAERGIVIGGALSPWGHGPSRVAIRSDADGFLEDLRDVIAIPISDPVATTLAGRAAVMVDIPRNGSGGGHIHTIGPMTGLASQGQVPTSLPAAMIVADVRGQTVFVEIWARSEQELATWRPVAMQILDTLHFDDVPGPTTRP